MESAFGVLDELEEEVQGTSKPKTSMYVDLFEGQCPKQIARCKCKAIK
jgi:hypothetical protein